MRYPASETAEKHTRILEQASRLFREHGFSGVSVSEIMKATGLTHGPFYNHFSSKEELMTESVEHTLLNTRGKFSAVEDSEAGKAEYIDWYLSTAHRDEAGKGCLMSALASEMRHQPQVKAPFTKHLKLLFERMATRFPWSSKQAARGDSIRTIASLVGGMILARAVDDEEFSEEILREVRQGLK